MSIPLNCPSRRGSVFTSPLWKKEGVTVKLVWDGNERLLEKGQPIVIGSKIESSIVIHNNKLVRDVHAP